MTTRRRTTTTATAFFCLFWVKEHTRAIVRPGTVGTEQQTKVIVLLLRTVVEVVFGGCGASVCGGDGK